MDNLAANLLRLRESKDLTQARLASGAGLSRLAYQNIEKGRSVPKVDTLQRLAEALSVGVDELLTPVPHLKKVRFRAKPSMKKRAQVLVQTYRRLRDYAELEELEPGNRNTASSLDLSASSTGVDRAKVAANQARTVLKLEAKENVRDICGLLEDRAGIKVVTFSLASDDFFGLSVADEGIGPAVIVNIWDRISVERWIFTAAHELGHLLLHGEDYMDGDVVRAEDKVREVEANAFASQFLMPDAAFVSEWDGAKGISFYERVLKVKAIFRVSYKTVLYRLGDRNAWMRFQVEHKRACGRTLTMAQEPEGLASDDFWASSPESLRAAEPDHVTPNIFRQDRLFRLVRAAVEKQTISLARGAEILDITLAEMRQLAKSWL
jgi:Zn-dependent peptidase ImmA (M78 family)/DNA-binding XRE family transcriptional regulator